MSKAMKDTQITTAKEETEMKEDSGRGARGRAGPEAQAARAGEAPCPWSLHSGRVSGRSEARACPWRVQLRREQQRKPGVGQGPTPEKVATEAKEAIS